MFISFNRIIDNILEKEHYSNRKVLQIHPLTLQIIKIWNSIIEAATSLNIDKSDISRVCSDNNRNHSNGYYWRYYNEFINDKYIRCDKNGKCDIFNLLPGGNLSNYIEPCFIYQFGEIWKDIKGFFGDKRSIRYS